MDPAAFLEQHAAASEALCALVREEEAPCKEWSDLIILAGSFERLGVCDDGSLAAQCNTTTTLYWVPGKDEWE